jgi:hypothetical protein
MNNPVYIYIYIYVYFSDDFIVSLYAVGGLMIRRSRTVSLKIKILVAI